MNIWALDKDTSIKHLLLLLAQEVGAERFHIVDVETVHHKAIRIGTRTGAATAYIYSYGQPEGHYGLHLEFPYNSEHNTSELEQMYEDLGYGGLLEMLKVHLQLDV